MAARGRKRKILLIGGIGAGLLLILLAAPLWFPWIARPLAGRLGFQYASYQRLGYGKFALSVVTVTNGATRFRAEKVEGFVPTLWVGHALLGDAQPTYLRVEDWKLELVEGGPREHGSSSAQSVYTNTQQAEALLSRLQRWLPKASFTNGVLGSSIQLRRDLPVLTFQVPVLNWAQGALSAQLVEPGTTNSAQLRAQLGTAPYELTFNSENLHLRSTNQVSPGPTELRIQSTNDWWTNRIEADARFGREGILPEQANLRADKLQLPTALLTSGPFKDLTGSLALKWQDKQFTVDVSASAQPAGATNLAPIDIEVHSTGSTHSVFISLARVSSPWLRAELTPGTEITFADPFLRQEALLAVNLDLARQPWFSATGTLTGQVRLRPGHDRFPAASFSFSGSGLAFSKVQTKALSLRGDFDWPRLDVSRLEVTLADESKASCDGHFDVAQQVVQQAHLRYEGAFARQFMAAGYSFSNALLDVSFDGPLGRLSHSGRLSVKDFTTPALKPLQLAGNWAGEMGRLQQCSITAGAGGSSVNLQGTLAATNAGAELAVQKFSLQQGARTVMELRQPTRVSFQQAATNAAHTSWHARLTPFQWVGGDRQLNLEGNLSWPEHGSVAVAARELDLGLFADFLKVPLVATRIRELTANAGWTNGPAEFEIQCSGGITRDGIPISLEAGLKGGKAGISIQRLEINSQTQSVVSAQGSLPIIVTPNDPKHFWEFLPGRELHLQAMTRTNSIFWGELAALTGLVLKEPRLTVDVSGNLDSLHGSVEGELEEAIVPDLKTTAFGPSTGSTQLKPGVNQKAPPGERQLLTLQQVRFSLELNPSVARLPNCSFSVKGQPVALTGEVPLGKAFWTGLRDRKVRLEWEKVRARIETTNMPTSILALWLPKVLTREGTVDLDLSLLPGLTLDGELRLTGGSTLPLGSFGVIRNIAADLKLDGRKAELKALTALVGAAPVSAIGSVDLSGQDWLKGATPPFELHAHGLNVAVARSPDFVVRTDLDVTFTKSNGAPVLINGTAGLRDSFYLHDLRDLIPGRVASVSQRPPYFSVTAEPWASWQLDLRLTGQRFLKVNSPLFRGVVSADLRLIGTLKDPIASGNLKVDSGLVRLPFANLEVTSGFVTLTSDDPYRPRLMVTATTRNAGYDVKMQATGPADEPLVQFSSTPPLTSEQVVLMLTAGVFPNNEASLTAQQRAGRVGLFFGKNLLSQFGLVDQGDRLTVRTGEEITETGRPTYHVEYKLSDRWYLVGEYDQFNDLNAGLRWRIYSK